MKKLMSFFVLTIGTLSVAFASDTYSTTKEATPLTNTQSLGTCTVTITVTNGSFSYSWTETYYAVSSTHCAQIARDRLEELKVQEVLSGVADPTIKPVEQQGFIDNN